jgi:hypothetical protein
LNGDTIGLLLDLDAGTLTAYKNGTLQEVMATELTGEYTWAVSLDQGYDTGVVRVEVAPPPLGAWSAESVERAERRARSREERRAWSAELGAIQSLVQKASATHSDSGKVASEAANSVCKPEVAERKRLRTKKRCERAKAKKPAPVVCCCGHSSGAHAHGNRPFVIVDGNATATICPGYAQRPTLGIATADSLHWHQKIPVDVKYTQIFF